MDIYQMPVGKPYGDWQEVFDDAQPMTWTAFNTGHIYLINTTSAPILIVGDAELTTWAMQDEILVSTVDGARGKQEVQRSATMIRTFHATYPHVQIWFSHDEDHL